jgi:fatty-acyl-CoA synthase
MTRTLTDCATVEPGRRLFELLKAKSVHSHMLFLTHGTVTYARMRHRSQQLAATLKAHGIVRGTRVATPLPNGEHRFILAMACSRLGAAMVLLNPRLGPKEIGELIERTQCRAIVYSASYRDGACANPRRSIEAPRLAYVQLVVASGVTLTPFELLRAKHLALDPGTALAAQATHWALKKTPPLRNKA